MTKNMLIKLCSKQTGIERKEVSLIIDSFLHQITKSLEAGEGVEIRRFGTFKIRVRRGHKGRNFKTGEPIPIINKPTIRFKQSRATHITI